MMPPTLAEGETDEDRDRGMYLIPVTISGLVDGTTSPMKLKSEEKGIASGLNTIDSVY